MVVLREAQRALRDGDAAGALRWLDDLDERHPGGVFDEERSAARVIALCAAGRAPEARAEASRFLGRYSDSVQVDRVRGSCAFAGTPAGASSPAPSPGAGPAEGAGASPGLPR
jgi:hypothetical protein